MRKLHWGKAVVSIVVTLAAMPLTHSLARVLKEGTTGVEQFYAGMGMGGFRIIHGDCGSVCERAYPADFIGIVRRNVLLDGSCRLSVYVFCQPFRYAGTTRSGDRRGRQPAGVSVTACYLRFWVMVMILYLFCTRNGCNFLNWWQKLFFGKHKKEIVVRAMTRHTSIVAFMEVITMLWTCYLVLMFCYDERFFGDHHPVTLLVGMLGLIGSIFMFAKLLRHASWDMSLRFGFATVIIFWIAVEVFDRIHFVPRSAGKIRVDISKGIASYSGFYHFTGCCLVYNNLLVLKNK